MLATRSHLVKKGALEDSPHFPKHILARNKQHFWPSGVWGDPIKARREKGQQKEEVVVKALGRLVTELEAFV